MLIAVDNSVGALDETVTLRGGGGAGAPGGCCPHFQEL